jgi:novobiocin biosynthesis protein NovU/D-mycarose 3-C-methyltransferase
MISNSAFDQIYHEHISYFNFTTFSKLLHNVGMEAYKVKQVNSQGGSLRAFVSFPGRHIIDNSVKDMLKIEGGIESIRARYMRFPKRVIEIRGEILGLVKSEILAGNKIAGYGASAKSTVLLNFLKLTNSEVIAIADKSPLKQGKFIPGAAIPVISPEELVKLGPNIIIIFAWNLKKEIVQYLLATFHIDVGMLTLLPKISFINSVLEE